LITGTNKMVYDPNKVYFDSTTQPYSTNILQALNTIAASPYGANLLNRGTTGANQINFTGLLPSEIGRGPAFGSKQGNPPLPTVNIDYPNAGMVYWFNSQGEIVNGAVPLVIAHELSHAIDDTTDPLDVDASGNFVPKTDQEMNESTFDFKGGAVRAQNAIASGLGWAGQDRASYIAATFQGTTFAGYTFQQGKSYTDGVKVNIVRFGDQHGSGEANDIDHSNRTDNSRDLIFALGGDDYVDAGGGNDYIYGGSGNDQLYGGTGNDHFYAELDDGTDLFNGGSNIADPAAAAAARATDGKDVVDYGENASALGPMTIQVGGAPLDSTYANLPDIGAATYVRQPGDASVDTLISIETITGTDDDDILDLRSLSQAVLADHATAQGGLAKIDLGSQNFAAINVGEPTGGGDLLDMTNLDEASIVHLNLATPKVWASADSDRRLTVMGVEDVSGSSHVDYIWGTDEGNYITSGQGEGGNKLYGMGGADKLVAEASGDILDGGTGNDILVLDSDKATVQFASGDGSDIVEFEHGDGNYTLRLNGLNPDDVELIAGGRDVYQDTIDGSRDLPDGDWYQSLTIRVKATGDQITLLENGRHIGPNDDGSTTAINKGFFPGGGQSVSEGFLDRVVFADGTVWNRNALWNSITNFDEWSYQPPTGFGDGQWTPENYLDHFTSTYLQADADYKAGRMGSSSSSAGSLAANSAANQLAQAMSGFKVDLAGEDRAFMTDDSLVRPLLGPPLWKGQRLEQIQQFA
jgi:hypothetical protein